MASLGAAHRAFHLRESIRLCISVDHSQGTAYNTVNFTQKDSRAVNTTVGGLLIQAFVCPSDPRTRAFDDLGTVFGPSSHGSCDSDWYVFSFPGAGQGWVSKLMRAEDVQRSEEHRGGITPGRLHI